MWKFNDVMFVVYEFLQLLTCCSQNGCQFEIKFINFVALRKCEGKININLRPKTAEYIFVPKIADGKRGRRSRQGCHLKWAWVSPSPKQEKALCTVVWTRLWLSQLWRRKHLCFPFCMKQKQIITIQNTVSTLKVCFLLHFTFTILE